MLAGILVSDTSEGAAFFEMDDGFGEAIFAAIEAGSLLCRRRLTSLSSNELSRGR